MIEPPNAVINRLHEELAKAGSTRKWAEAHAFSPAFISDILSGRRDITDRLCEALEFKRVVLWEDLRHTEEGRPK